MKLMTNSVLVALAATVLVNTISISSASAAACTKGSEGKAALCVEGATQEGEVAFTGKGKSSTTVLFHTSSMEIKCTSMTDSGVFLASSSGAPTQVADRVIHFTGCTTTFTGCTVQPLTFGEGKAPLSGEVSLSGTEFKWKSFPSTEKNSKWQFGVLTITGSSCSVGGEHSITSAPDQANHGPTCTLENATVEAVEHELACTNASEMELLKKELRITSAEEVALSGANSGKKWSFFEG